MRLKLFLLILAFLFSLNYAQAACTGTSYSGSGNWNVGDTTVCSDMEIILAQNGDINVTGNLTLTNVNLTMNGTSDGGANITVYRGGVLVLNVSNSNQLNRITSANTANEYAFAAYNGSILRIDHANLSEIGWTTALDTGGIYIETLNFSLYNTNFVNNFRAFILDPLDTIDSDIHVANITISNSGSNPFYLWDEVNGALLENIATGSTHQRGIVFGGYNNTFINITMTDTTSSVGTSGAALWRRGDGTNNIRQSIFINCNFTNGYDEALSTTSGDNFRDIFINSHFTTLDRDNNDVTILFTTGNQNRQWNFINSTFNQSDVTVDSFSPLNISWYLDVTVNSSEGNNVSGAIVQVYNNSGQILANVTTDSTGRTSLMNITEYVEQSSGKVYNTNITINVSYPTSQFDSNSRSLNLTSSQTINIQLTENDASVPNVTSLLPSSGSSYSTGDSITIKANISDDTTLGNSTINITRPDGTVEQFNLTQDSCHQYIKEYTIPDVTGTYTVNFIGNDFYGNQNASETLTFTAGSVSNSNQVSSSGGGSTTTRTSEDCGTNCVSKDNKLNWGDKLTFIFNGIEYTIFVDYVSKSKDYILIKITSKDKQAIDLTLNVGEKLSIDVDRSGDNDITLNLKEITNYLEAVLDLESINKEEAPLKSPYVSEEIPEYSLITTSIVIPIIIVVGIFIIVIFSIVIKNHQKNNRMFKRKDPHKKRRKMLIILGLAIVSVTLLPVFYTEYVSSVSGETADSPLIMEFNINQSIYQDVVPFNATFTTTYENCRDSIQEVKWDFDNDGDFEATGFSTTWQFNNSGNITVNTTVVTRNSGNFTRLTNLTGYEALLTITFDDSHISQIDVGLPTLSSLNVTATAFTVPEWVNSSKYEDDGFTQWTSYMSWNNITQLSDAGWDIQSHGVGSGNYTYCVQQGYGADITAAKSNSQCNQLIIHPQLGKINNTRVVIELNDSKTLLLDHGYTVEGIAYPGGNYSDYSLTQTAIYYDWGRTVGGGVTGGQSNELPPNNANNYTIYTRPANDNAWVLANYTSWIDEAVSNNKWMVWNFHIMYSNCGSTDLCVNVSNTNNTINYARSNSVKIVTMVEAISGSWKLTRN